MTLPRLIKLASIAASQWRQFSAPRHMLVQTDHYIGEMVVAIDKLGIAKDTLIIVTADNGAEDPHNGAGQSTGWTGPWDGTYNVPVGAPDDHAPPVRRPPRNLGPQAAAHPFRADRAHDQSGDSNGQLNLGLHLHLDGDNTLRRIPQGIRIQGPRAKRRVTEALKKARVSGDWSPFIAESETGIRSWLMMRDGKYKYVRYLCADYIEELMISKRTRWS